MESKFRFHPPANRHISLKCDFLFQPNAALADGQSHQGYFSVCVCQQCRPVLLDRAFSVFFSLSESKSFCCACLAELGTERRKSCGVVDTIKSSFLVFSVSLDDESCVCGDEQTYGCQ